MNRVLVVRRLFSVLLLLPIALVGKTQTTDLKDATAIHERGQKLQRVGNFYGAVEMYRAALVRNPHFLEPIRGLAECFFLLEEYEEALRQVTKARGYAQANLGLRNLEGRIRIGLGELDAARELFGAVLAKEPNNLEARFGLAELDIAQGDASNAAAKYIETLKVAPANRRALVSLAVLYDEMGDQQSASHYLELALKYHAADPLVHYTAARHLSERAEYESAERHLSTALALDDAHLASYLLLAEVNLRTGYLEGAMDAARAALYLDPDESLAWYSLGLAYAEANQVGEAISAFERALHVRPDDELARIEMENRVLESLEIGDALRQRLAVYHVQLGQMHETRNVLEKALVEFRRALRLDPFSREARLGYARVFKARGFLEKYVRELRVLENIGHADAFVLDEIEIYESQLYDSVASRWNLDQYGLDRERFSLAVFNLQPLGREIHPFGGRSVTAFLYDLMLRYEDVNLVPLGAKVDSFEEGFRRARIAGTDYFVLVSFEESERSFAGVCRLYLAGTGAELAAFHEYRTGNERVVNTAVSLAAKVHELLPLRGMLVQRAYEQGVINLGRGHGLQEDDELYIVKRGNLKLKHDSVGFRVAEEDIVGRFTVVELDEALSVGTVTNSSFFDLVNIRDEVVYLPPELTAPPPTTAEQEEQGGLIRRLFGRIGL